MHSQISQILVSSELWWCKWMECERDGEGQMLQEEQGHHTLFFHSLTHFLLHTHIIALIMQRHWNMYWYTHSSNYLRRKGKYVMVNKMKHEWRERTPVRTQYLYIRPLQCDAGSHFEHLHNCAVLYIQTDSIEDELYADKLVTERNY